MPLVMLLNPLPAKLFIGNIKNVYTIYIFLYTDMTQLIEKLPRVRQELTNSIVSTMGADVLETQEAMASAAMLFTLLNRINSVPAC